MTVLIVFILLYGIPYMMKRKEDAKRREERYKNL